jgi:hypothetical protein
VGLSAVNRHDPPKGRWETSVGGLAAVTQSFTVGQVVVSLFRAPTSKS